MTAVTKKREGPLAAMQAGLFYCSRLPYTCLMEAQCQCGNLTAQISGFGAGVMCHCKACQRRSGSPYGMMVYFSADAVEITGKATDFTRLADSGNEVTTGFCPICGSTMYLKTALHPDGIGIAVGAIQDWSPPYPVRSVFEEGNKHDWVTVPQSTQRFPRGRNG